MAGKALCFLLLLLTASFVMAQPAQAATPWWDDFPLISSTSDLNLIKGQHATIAFAGTQTDPSWGIYGQRVTEQQALTQAIHDAGMKSIAYYESFGTSTSFIVELGQRGSLDYTPIQLSHWAWQYYGGGPIAWVGPQNYFDCESFTGVYNRLHPRYGGPQMKYPDGTVATGYVNNDSTDPRNSRVFDAGSSKNILGFDTPEYGINDAVNAINPDTGLPRGPLNGLVNTGNGYAGHVSYHKDTACPMWIDLDRASVLYAADKGLDGIWTDNFSPWDSLSSTPLERGFGEWSVAGFRTYLSHHFTANQLQAMGVTNVSSFDIRTALREKCRSFGGNDSVMWDWGAWMDSRWLDDPLWHAYLIYKRQTGSAALSNYYNSCKAAALQAGKSDFFICGNDIPMFSLGWARGDLDMVSTEMSPGWSLGASSRGITMPPFGRFAPVYKLAREHAKSRFVNIWMYIEGDYAQYQGRSGIANALEYEMLATHALPMHFPEEARKLGNYNSNAAFFEYVGEIKGQMGGRVPVEDVGIYYSSSSLLAFMTPAGMYNFDNQPHQFAYLGWGTALGELHYQYRAIPEWKLNSATLAGLRVLIIPNAEVLDPADVTNFIDPWVRGGGLLLVTGNSGYRKGEDGNFDVNTAGLSLAGLTGVSSMPGSYMRMVTSVGQGKVIFESTNMGMEYYNVPVSSARVTLLPKIKADMDELLSGRKTLRLDPGTNAPGTVGLTLYEDAAAKRLFIDANNLNIDKTADAMRATPTISFTVEVPAWVGDPAKSDFRVKVLSPTGSPTATLSRVAPDRLQVTLSSFEYYASIVITSYIHSDASGQWKNYQ